MLLLFLLLALQLPVFALSEPVTLKQLKVDDAIVLPTVRSQRILTFTKPKTWTLSPSSKILVSFQHSLQLLPNRSWLQIRVNDQQVQHIPLTPQNAAGTTLTIPLPVGILKDFNTLTFRVEQHYTDKCEDPLDPSLWTQILPESKIIFEYAPVLPEVNLSKYPYPIIDPLTYSPTPIRYVIPKQASDKEIQAMGYVNLHLAQAAGEKETRTQIAYPGESNATNSHTVLIGTAGDNTAIAQYQAEIAAKTGYTLSGKQWINSASGQPLTEDSGLVVFIPNNTVKGRAILVVTGNTPGAVLQAAQFLTTRPLDSGLTGPVALVGDDWSPQSNSSARVPRYIEHESRSLAQLGYHVQSVEKINAPPITYQVPVMSDFKNSAAKLYLDLIYSYGNESGGDKINPEFSSLEIRMNDLPLANIPLTDPSGTQTGARARVYIPRDAIKPYNKLVAQYHLMPDKYGFCVDNYNDKAWGKIHDDSKLTVEGSPGSLLPNIGIFNYTTFPYSRDENFQNTHFVLPMEMTKGTLRAFLGVTTRLGRSTLSDTGLRFTLSKGDAVPEQGKNIIVIQDLAHPIKLPAGSRLEWLTGAPLLQKLSSMFLPENKSSSISVLENGSGVYLEQYQSPWRGENVITALSALTPNGFETLAASLESDDDFAALTSGPLKLLTQNGPSSDFNGTTFNDGKPAEQRIENGVSVKTAGGGWFGWLNFDWLLGMPWWMLILWAVGLVFGWMILVTLIRRLFGRRRR